jgi:hypothetical protein
MKNMLVLVIALITLATLTAYSETGEKTAANRLQEMAIQIGTFNQESSANALKEKVSAVINKDVEVVQENGLFKVWITGFSDMDEINGFMPNLELLGIADFLILPFDSRSVRMQRQTPESVTDTIRRADTTIGHVPQEPIRIPSAGPLAKKEDSRSEIIISVVPDLRPDTSRNNAVRIFLDCRNCDMNYTRQEIPYVNYVRDYREAQVYVNVTTQAAGNGGNLYTYTFTGQRDFAGMNDTVTLSTSPDMTGPVIREKRTNILKMGLMRYIARTPLANEIRISHNPTLEAEPVEDNWNNWVFEISSSPRFEAEETAKRFQIWNSINVSRITPDIKFEVDLDQSTNRRRFIDEATDTTYLKSSNSLDIIMVKSLGNHWSAGLMWDNGTSTESNFNFYTELMPAIEYDLYPYSAATHKQLRILYGIGYSYNNYIDSTIYDRMTDNFFKHELRVAYKVQEKWGSINISLTESNILNDITRHAIYLYGYLRLRIVKGLSLSLNGGISYNNFQPNLRKGEISEADRLLQLKQLASSYWINAGGSISYTFGSIYNNVVNPRFGN